MTKLASFLALAFIGIGTANALQIDVFTTRSIPAYTTDIDQQVNSVNIYYIDDLNSAISHLQQSINGLQQDEAMSVAQNSISANTSELKTALNSVVLARNNEINRYPAVVFDGKYEVLGTSDIGLAYQQYLIYGQQQGAGQ